MAAMGHLERFPPEGVSGGCQIGQGTSAGAHSGDGLAPIPTIDGIAIQPTRSAFAVIRRYGTDIPSREQLVAHAINGILALGGYSKRFASEPGP